MEFHQITEEEESAIVSRKAKQLHRSLRAEVKSQEPITNFFWTAEVAYQRNGTQTVAILVFNNKVYIGKTVKSPRDEENESRAKRIALLRAVREAPIEKFWDEMSVDEVTTTTIYPGMFEVSDRIREYVQEKYNLFPTATGAEIMRDQDRKSDSARRS